MADLLGIGRSGLNVSKKALEVTGHNLSNVNTEGFSRQRVMQSTAIPISNGGFVQGTGAKVDGVRRFNDEFIDKRLGNALANNKFYEARTENLEKLTTLGIPRRSPIQVLTGLDFA